MFAKISVLFLALFLICSTAIAASVVQEVMDATIDGTPLTATSGTIGIQHLEKVAFFLVYDETEVGNSISADITIEISADNWTWIAGSFFDLAGGVASLETTEAISSDSTYYFWLERDMTIPYVRIVVTSTNTDSDDLLDIVVYMAGVQ